jgi:glycosyltransferase involved in cell wall biosynthesis
MAAGKPVVASKIPPFTEIVIDGETGLLVDAGRPEAFAHAIRWLLVHPEKARQMGTQGQARVLSHFSVQKMTAETLSVYNSLLRSRRDEATHVF